MAGAGPRNSKERSRLEQSPRNDYSQRREKSEDQNLREFQPINLEGDEEEQVEEMDGVDHWWEGGDPEGRKHFKKEGVST